MVLVRIIVLTLSVMLVGMSNAQQDILMLNVDGVFQSKYVNPALGPNKGLHIGMPFSSSVSAQHHNNFIQPAGLFKIVEDHVEFQTDTYLENIKDDNRAGFDLAIDLFSIGIPLKNNYFSFAIREKASAEFRLPGDILRFPITGNAQFDVNGGLTDLSDMDFALNHYIEYGFGWQRTIGEKLNIGARAKVLFGKENIRTTNNNFQWQTDPEDYTWDFSGDFELETSGIQSQFDSLDGNTLLENGKVAKYVFGSKNRGLGLDIGAQYAIGDRLSIGLSLVDIGYIKYSNDVRNFSGIGDNVVFAGVEITDELINGEGSFSDSLDTAFSNLVDALQESFAVDQNESSYKVGLRTKSYMNVGYDLILTEKAVGKVGITLHSDIRNGDISSPIASLNYTHTWKDRISVTTAYSFLQPDHKNLALGLSVRGGPIVWYTTFDNLMWLNMTKITLPGSDGELTYPSFSQNASVHFGMNILLKKKEKEQEPRRSDS